MACFGTVRHSTVQVQAHMEMVIGKVTYIILCNLLMRMRLARKLQFCGSGKTDLQPVQQMKHPNKRTKGWINDFPEGLKASENITPNNLCPGLSTEGYGLRESRLYCLH